MKDSFSDLAYPELLVKREDLRKQHRDARFNTVVGHVDNPVLARTLRRKIARLNTLVHEYEIGIRVAAAEPATAAATRSAAATASEPTEGEGQ